jgi:hypothetical protein
MIVEDTAAFLGGDFRLPVQSLPAVTTRGEPLKCLEQSTS